MKRTFFTILFTFLCSFLLACNVDASTTYIQGIVKQYCSVKKSPDKNSATLTSDINSNISLSSPEAVEIIGESGDYYQIKFMYNGFKYTGYVNKSSVVAKTYTTDDAYEEYLLNLGFPRDYASKLAILHAIHPNWEFAPSFTNGVQGGMDFYTAVNGEADVVARNLLDSSNTSLRSTEDGAYKNGEWIALSGSGWYAASRQTIAFYMDPRNFLDESHIFMFENLGFNSATQTPAVINKVLGGTFMSNPFECKEGANNCPIGVHYFVDTFMSTGNDKKVSPVHLATRVVQEQGSKGSVLSLGYGFNGQYVGYYNFFNIAASGITDEEVILNGLKYAMNRNWNNQRVSIYDGASTIATNYIGRGQSTQYYQKFNTIASPIYGNQYMQNLRSPYTEGYRTYTSYYSSFATQEDWNNAVYDFLIPVYSNMGGETTLDTSGNADATLKSLNISSCRLNPSFQSSAYSYECFTPMDVKNVTVEAEATNVNAKVNNPGTVEINADEVIINIEVTAANGNTATYSINIHRIETDGYTPTEILNGIGIKVNGSYASNIEVGSDVSNVINSIVNKHHFVTIKLTDKSNAEIKEGTIRTGDKITITNAGITTTFTVVIYGDTSGDGLIDIRDLLIIQKHLVKSQTLSGEYYNSSDINKDGTIDIRDLLLEQKYLLGAYSISQG